jgi:N-succinyldiaminopimelate aminotransferase
MNPHLTELHAYPFEKLNQLKANLTPPEHLTPINLSIGEPQHPTPAFIHDALTSALAGLGKYPLTKGNEALRQAIADWLILRFQLPAASIDPNAHILPVNGTREALFAIAQTVVDATQTPAPLVLMPNPFYQIYEGAALLAGAKPYYLNCLAAHDFQPDFAAVPPDVWQRCQLLYICSPNNPSGSVLSAEKFRQVIELADEYDFVIASDECYSELYADEAAPPLGLLQVCASLGRLDFKRCVVFHSLSKRSNAPGLRSGFVAGDATLLQAFLRYRTYHGCAMSPVVQAASIAAWRDETHVQENRAWYRAKFDAVLAILQPVLPMVRPPASFYLWPELPLSDTEFAARLFAQGHVTVLPGSYLSRPTAGDFNPGAHRVRMALVAPLADCETAAQRIVEILKAG